jgi:short subunit dehydrogenase-like uncharacterized protein
MNRNIVLLGATGYTGSLIARKLNDLGIKFSIAGRDPNKLDLIRDDCATCVDQILFDSTNSDDLKKLEKFDIALNCIGPFNIFSKKIVEYLANHKCLYIDITGEQDFVKKSLDNLYTKVVSNNSLFCHSCSFESALVGFMTDLVCSEEREYESIDSFYSFAKAGPSPGTRFTMKTHHYFNQYIVQDSKLINVDEFPVFKEIQFSQLKDKTIGYFTPFPEVIYSNKKYNSKNIGSYTLMTIADAEMTKRMNEVVKNDIDRDIVKLSKSKFKGPAEEERQDHQFFIGVKSVTKAHDVQTIELIGRDMYQVTANLVCAGLTFLLTNPSDISGVKCLSEVVSDDFFSKFVLDNNLEIFKNGQVLTF